MPMSKMFSFTKIVQDYLIQKLRLFITAKVFLKHISLWTATAFVLWSHHWALTLIYFSSVFRRKSVCWVFTVSSFFQSSGGLQSRYNFNWHQLSQKPIVEWILWNALIIQSICSFRPPCGPNHYINLIKY